MALRGWVAALPFNGALDREAFDAYVTELLVPRLRRSDVVLLDNLRVHHAGDVEEAVRAARARVLWLPSYSPDFSPLESCWSKVKAVVRGIEPFTVIHTKTGRNRQIPMNPNVRAALLELCRGKRPDDFVFYNPRTGDRVKEIKTAFRGACADAGIEGMQWKVLRATFATRLGEAGYTAFEIAELLGHSDIRTTRKYVRITEGKKREAVHAAMFRQAKVIEMPVQERKEA